MSSLLDSALLTGARQNVLPWTSGISSVLFIEVVFVFNILVPNYRPTSPKSQVNKKGGCRTATFYGNKGELRRKESNLFLFHHGEDGGDGAGGIVVHGAGAEVLDGEPARVAFVE